MIYERYYCMNQQVYASALVYFFFFRRARVYFCLTWTVVALLLWAGRAAAKPISAPVCLARLLSSPSVIFLF
jgi:hypothetical protein